MKFSTRAYVTNTARLMRMIYPKGNISTLDAFATAMHHVGRGIQQEREEATSTCYECGSGPWDSCECREWAPWDFAPRHLALDCEAPDMHRKVFSEMLAAMRPRDGIKYTVTFGGTP